MTYICFQLSSFLLWIPPLKKFLLGFIEQQGKEADIALVAWWSSISAGIALIIAFILISRNKNFWNCLKGDKMPVLPAIGWGLAGFFMIYLGQIIGVQIESSLGIKPGSENTEAIINVTKTAPIMILASVIFGPILEELVFRRVIFGSIMEAQNNFWVAAFVSSIFFAIIHLDFSHIILYTITGFIFAFLYNKTKRLITPIISHMLLNGFVTYMQLNLDNIQQFFNQ
ncbi:CPBP family intramembrane metalloprotease [Ureibacillus terrenus]|uniref:CPBP family intramembrane metalloprotease n=3 Tax=Caryophanaceae TaxID=186818 RepID=A0A540UY69_9BACL|nr:CPBP family intramembrane metalloprotease [Ureibacillus terrenus]